MGLNLSGLQIAQELDINKDDARAMVQQIRQGIVNRCPPTVWGYTLLTHPTGIGSYVRKTGARAMSPRQNDFEDNR
jgi:hypothetical protein